MVNVWISPDLNSPKLLVCQNGMKSTSSNILSLFVCTILLPDVSMNNKWIQVRQNNPHMIRVFNVTL